MKASDFILIFKKSIGDYHQKDDINAIAKNPFDKGSLEFLLYEKNWIDTVQWHLEDLIRNPEIDPAEGMTLKRRIDKLNQKRTDIVEFIDAYFLNKYKDVVANKSATINTESPAWAIDRLSILQLKIYHMKLESQRADASQNHRQQCLQKLEVLLTQESDLSLAIDELIDKISQGKKVMKVYKQMKMYNDEETNPVLYTRKL
ncbi:MAG: DUF4254 domain-containing protein [Chitinophagaceae bacterium]|nr:DUF4254 domain-containing protein [Chitinophagaceae bacterium]